MADKQGRQAYGKAVKNMAELLRTIQLNKSFSEKVVLNDISFALEKGSITALMAASGTGKTTLLRILMGLESPDSGLIQNSEPLQLSAVFQEDRLCENLSPLSNIRLVTGSSLSTSVLTAELSKLGLTDCISHPVRKLSGGERRRVALLRALLAPWNLLLLDEPFKGLDPDTKKAAMDYVLSFSRTEKAILLVTHDLYEAEYMADHILRI